ncbi:hypothetical protein F5884DRAFT_859778 [Xylogone sp. PMI_703]|nr:hypothetical protein F5884DRAFT_859778 [Xylogone sp. PMI_703]
MPSSSHHGTDAADEEAVPFIKNSTGADTHTTNKLHSNLLPFLRQNFWILTTCILAIALITTLVRDNAQRLTQGTYENGYRTEFGPSREAIHIKEVQFTGGLRYDPNGTLYATSNPEEPVYVGPPSKELDDAWEDLVHGMDKVKQPEQPARQNRYLAITPEQAAEVGGNLHFMKDVGYYSAGVDVLHSLHCLNMLRMSLDLDHYKETGNIEQGENGRKHLDHCVNHLRQIIQCHGDMTPLPIVWEEVAGFPNGGRIIPEFDQVHTCRDFRALREWSTIQDQGVRKAAAAEKQAGHA